MSIFKGKLSPLVKFDGGIKKKKLGLKVQIRSANPVSGAKVKNTTRFGGWMDAVPYFSGAMKRIALLFRFIASDTSFTMSHEAQTNAAPTVEISADTAFSDKAEAPVAAQPAKPVKADRTLHMAKKASMISYNAAAASLFKRIWSAVTAKVMAVPGAVIRFRNKTMRMKRKAKTSTAPGAIAESRFNKQASGVTAETIPAPAVCSLSVLGFDTEHDAPALAAASVDVQMESIIPQLTHYAKATWWMFPEQTGNQLTIPQAFSGIQNGNRVVVDMYDDSVYWANAAVTGNVLNLVFVNTATPNDNEMELI